MEFRKGLLSAFAAAGLVALSVACASPAAPGGPQAGAPSGPKSGGIIRLDVDGETESFNPMLKDGPTQQLALGGIYTPLLRLEFGEQAGYTGGKILPYMADKWEVSADATEVTFSLRKDLKWQNKPPVNGRAITSEDIKWNLLRFRDERGSMAKFIVQDITDVTTPDPYTVRVKMSKPFVPFLAYMAWDKALFHPKELVDQGILETTPVGAGPFMLDSFQRGAVWRFKRNPDFFMKDSEGRGLPYLDGYEAYPITDPSTQAAAFVAKQIDVCGPCQRGGSPVLDTIKSGAPGAKFTAYADPGGTEIYISNIHAPFNDPRVRTAVRLGIDPQGMIQALYKGEAQLSVAGIGTAYTDWALPMDEVKKLYPHDLAKAKDLLREAGYGSGGPSITIHTPNNNRATMTYTELLQSQLRAIGFDAKIAIVEWAEMITRRRGGEYQLYTSGKSQENDPDGNLLPVYHSKGDVNYSRIKDDQLDAMLERQRTILDGAERKKAIQDIVRRIADQTLALNPVASQRVFYQQAHVKGYHPHVYWGYGQKFMETWLDK